MNGWAWAGIGLVATGVVAGGGYLIWKQNVNPSVGTVLTPNASGLVTLQANTTYVVQGQPSPAIPNPGVAVVQATFDSLSPGQYKVNSVNQQGVNGPLVINFTVLQTQNGLTVAVNPNSLVGSTSGATVTVSSSYTGAMGSLGLGAVGLLQPAFV